MVSMEAGENGMLGRVGDLPREMQPREFALYVKELSLIHIFRTLENSIYIIY